MNTEEDIKSFKKAQKVNTNKLAKLDAKEELTLQETMYREKIQEQYDIIEAKLSE